MGAAPRSCRMFASKLLLNMEMLNLQCNTPDLYCNFPLRFSKILFLNREEWA